MKSLQSVALTLRDVEIEEVAVEYRLHTSRNNSYQVEEAFEVVAVDPVEDVKCSVRAERKQIVARDRLGFTRLADHKELRQDGNCFQVD